MPENKKKRAPAQKPEDFVGWKSPDGKLEVIGINGKQGRAVTFKVTCAECFENDCQCVLNKLLDNCDLEEVTCV